MFHPMTSCGREMGNSYSRMDGDLRHCVGWWVPVRALKKASFSREMMQLCLLNGLTCTCVYDVRIEPRASSVRQLLHQWVISAPCCLMLSKQEWHRGRIWGTDWCPVGIWNAYGYGQSGLLFHLLICIKMPFAHWMAPGQVGSFLISETCDPFTC